MFRASKQRLFPHRIRIWGVRRNLLKDSGFGGPFAGGSIRVFGACRGDPQLHETHYLSWGYPRYNILYVAHSPDPILYEMDLEMIEAESLKTAASGFILGRSERLSK